MRVLPWIVLAGCGSKDDEELPPPIAFRDAAEAGEVSAELDPASANRLAAWVALAQFLDLLLSDNTVRNTLYVNGGLGSADLVAYTPCWSLPPAGTAGLDYDIDLSGCTTEGYSGAIHVEDTPEGPLVLTFQGTQYLDWTYDGGLALDSTATRVWAVYPADESANPTGALSITTNDGVLNLAIDAAMELAGPPENEIEWSGTVSEGGATLALDTAYDTQPAACSCQTAGDVTLDASLTELVVTIDLDDLEASDNGADDSAIAFPVAAPAGSAVFGTGETCGIYTLAFGGFDVVLGSAELSAGVEDACDGGYFDDGTCTRLREAASAGEVTVAVPERKTDDALTEWASNAFDEGICFTGY